MENGNFGGGGNNPNNNNNNNGDNNRNNGGRNNRNGQMVMMFVLITLVALLFMSLISKWQTQMTAREISYTEFLQMVDEGKVESVELTSQQIDITPKKSEDELVPITYYTGYVGDEELVRFRLREYLENAVRYYDAALNAPNVSELKPQLRWMKKRIRDLIRRCREAQVLEFWPDYEMLSRFYPAAMRWQRLLREWRREG